MSRDVREAAVKVGDMIEEVPDGARRIQAFFAQSENVSRLLTLFLNGGIAAVIALISALFLGRPAQSAIGKMKTLPSKIGWGFVYILLKGIPYLILCIGFTLLFEVYPSFEPGRTVVLLFFSLLFL